MNIQNHWKQIAIGAVAALAVSAGALWTVNNVSAATVAQQAQDWSLTDMVQDQFRRGGGRDGDKAMQIDQQALLAEALGISEDELQTAQQEAFDAALAQAVEQELITQEQADALKERADQRGVPGFGKMGNFGGIGGEIDQAALLAEALDITVDELKAAQETAVANGLKQAVEDGNLTQEQADMMQARMALREYLDERMQGAYEDAVQAALADGAITQAQADQLLSQEQMFGRGFGGPGFGGSEFGGRGHGGHGGGRGHDHFDDQPNGETPDDAEPSDGAIIPQPDSNL